MSKIRVLSVDDSALMRQIMTEIINSHSDMEMVATAPDPLVARDLIKKFNPDVLTLDVEMPRMDGLDFLEKLMRLRPMPVVMVSSLTGKGSEVTLRALELGAIDFVTKPRLGIREGMLAYSEMIAEKVRTAAKASLAAHKPLSAPTTLKAGPLLSSEKLIAIGASTGGTEAIRHVLQPLPLSSPALLITQHMPPGFTRSFADRLNKLCQIGVKEAEDGERVLPGHAYIAPGDRHMELARSGANYQIKIHDGPAVIWIESALKEQAQIQGYTVVEASTVVATHLNHLISQHAAELFGRQEAQQLLDRVAQEMPKLTEDLVPGVVTLTTLHKVLQNLLDEKVPIRDMRTILETLAEHAPIQSDPHELTAVVRVALGRAITQQWFPGKDEVHVIGLDTPLERLLLQALQGGGGLEPGLADRLLAQTQEALSRQEMLGAPPVLLVNHALRPLLSRFLRRSLPQLVVLSNLELSDNRHIRMTAIIGGK
ncbi:TPA: chemotaxis-specific protein-glutamate methyltransferase CheB [Shigella sonnei]